MKISFKSENQNNDNKIFKSNIVFEIMKYKNLNIYIYKIYFLRRKTYSKKIWEIILRH